MFISSPEKMREIGNLNYFFFIIKSVHLHIELQIHQELVSIYDNKIQLFNSKLSKKKTDQSYDPSENRIQFENSGEDSWETSRDNSKENSYDDEWVKVSDNHSS